MMRIKAPFRVQDPYNLNYGIDKNQAFMKMAANVNYDTILSRPGINLKQILEGFKYSENFTIETIQFLESTITKISKNPGYSLSESDISTKMMKGGTSSSRPPINSKRSAPTDLSKEVLQKKIKTGQESQSTALPTDSSQRDQINLKMENNTAVKIEHHLKIENRSNQSEEIPDRIRAQNIIRNQLKIENQSHQSEGIPEEIQAQNRIGHQLKIENRSNQWEKIPDRIRAQNIHEIIPNLAGVEIEQRGENRIGEPEIPPTQNIPEADQNIAEIAAEPVLEEGDENIFNEPERPQRRQFPTRYVKNEIYGYKISKTLEAPAWRGQANPGGFYLREKLPGVVCIWDGEDSFITRNKARYFPPREFVREFPKECLIGILNQSGKGASTVTRKIEKIGLPDFEDWRDLQFVVYDVNRKASFEDRIATIEDLLIETESPFIKPCEFHICGGLEDFKEQVQSFEEKKSEGFFVNHRRRFTNYGRKAGFYFKKLEK